MLYSAHEALQTQLAGLLHSSRLSCSFPYATQYVIATSEVLLGDTV